MAGAGAGEAPWVSLMIVVGGKEASGLSFRALSSEHVTRNLHFSSPTVNH